MDVLLILSQETSISCPAIVSPGGVEKLLHCLSSMPLLVERLYLASNSITPRHAPKQELVWICFFRLCKAFKERQHILTRREVDDGTS